VSADRHEILGGQAPVPAVPLNGRVAPTKRIGPTLVDARKLLATTIREPNLRAVV